MNQVTILHKCGHESVTSGEGIPNVGSLMGPLLSNSLCSVCAMDAWRKSTFDSYCQMMRGPSEVMDVDTIEAAITLKLNALRAVETRNEELTRDLIDLCYGGILTDEETRVLKGALFHTIMNRFRVLSNMPEVEWWLENGQEVITSLDNLTINDLVKKGEENG